MGALTMGAFSGALPMRAFSGALPMRAFSGAETHLTKPLTSEAPGGELDLLGLVPTRGGVA